MTIELKPLAPAEAIAFFQAKGFKIGFDWRDTWANEHARSFTVAKAMQLDLLTDIRAAVDDAIAKGTTLQQFKARLQPLLEAKGWWGRKTMVDPQTGSGVAPSGATPLAREVQLGSPRRLQIIFQTNVRTARAAGAWERIHRSKATRPYLRYSAVLDSRTRPAHRAWNGTVLPVDDPWWDTHYPPNGWNCRCTVIQLSARDLRARDLKVTEPPPSPTKPWFNARTGETVEVPQGIDPGFGHNVGQAAEMISAERAFVEKLVDRPADLAATAYAETKRVLTPGLVRDFSQWARDVGSGAIPSGNSARVVGAMEPGILEAAIGAFGDPPSSAALIATDDQLRHALRDTKGLPDDLVARLPAIVAAPKAVLLDTQDPALLYVAEAAGGQLVKFVWRLDFTRQIRAGARRAKAPMNDFRTAGLVDAGDLKQPRYHLVEGAI
jgi:SPP1 gp7 family putative phage head morphogenesis protein